MWHPLEGMEWGGDFAAHNLQENQDERSSVIVNKSSPEHAWESTYIQNKKEKGESPLKWREFLNYKVSLHNSK